MVGSSKPVRVKREPPKPEPVRSGIDCVVLTCLEPDAGLWENLFPSVGIRIHVAQMLVHADFLVTVTGANVVLMDTVFPDGSWVDALNMLARFHPYVAPLILADPVDAPFMSEALNLGAFQILWRPAAMDKLLSSIRLASEASGERAMWQRDRTRRNAHSMDSH